MQHDMNQKDLDLWMYALGEAQGWNALKVRVVLMISPSARERLKDMRSMSRTLSGAFINPTLGLRGIPTPRVFHWVGFSLVALLIFLGTWAISTRSAQSAVGKTSITKKLCGQLPLIKKNLSTLANSSTNSPTFKKPHCDK